MVQDLEFRTSLPFPQQERLRKVTLCYPFQLDILIGFSFEYEFVLLILIAYEFRLRIYR